MAACGGAPPGGDAEPADLGGRTFLSVDVTERGVPRPLVAATQVRLDFREDGTFGASAGCNSMGGQWRLDGTRLEVEHGGMTAMGCDPELQAQDAWLTDFLIGSPAVALAGDRLALSNGGVVIQLADEAVVDPARPLIGTQWVVEGIRDGDSVFSVPADAGVSIRIAENGATTVETGCNTARMAASIEGDQLGLTPGALTRRACSGPEAEARQRAVLEVLSGDPITWSIDGATLVLDRGAVGLLLRAG